MALQPTGAGGRAAHRAVSGRLPGRGGDFDAERREAELLRGVGLEPEVRAEVLALPPGHPYLRLPLQFSVSLEPRLQRLVSPAELGRLRQAAETEIADPSRWGTTFTLIQTWAKVPRSS